MKTEIRYWKDNEGRAKWTYLPDRAPAFANAGFDDLRFFRFDSNISRSIEVGFSTNHAENRPEAGLSCYFLENCMLTTRSEITAEIVKQWNASGFLALNGQFSDLWEIEGKIVGYGSDGEPLVQNVKVIGKVV